MSERILILGGTKEAVKLAEKLDAEGHDVTTTLAGRTDDPKPVPGKIRIGGFGGSEGIADWLKNNSITRIIDATHPFALQISKNAKLASEKTGIPLTITKRKPWKKQLGDIWIEVDGLEEAIREIPSQANAFLALGSQYIEPFFRKRDVKFTIRMVDSPKFSPKYGNYSLILGKPSANWRVEAALLREHSITHIICRNSGGDGSYAKIRAARELAIPVIIVKMPK